MVVNSAPSPHQLVIKLAAGIHFLLVISCHTVTFRLFSLTIVLLNVAHTTHLAPTPVKTNRAMLENPV